MLDPYRHKVLVVDDDAAVRDSLVMLLQASDYDVSVAIDGFDALGQLKKSLPAVVISDLNMPQMSGFEFLSVVRRRFPHISVIAMSGAYPSGDAVPGGVIADAFHSKGRSWKRWPASSAPLQSTRQIMSANPLPCGYREMDMIRMAFLMWC
jgi:CheY-like chemotaxis protein